MIIQNNIVTNKPQINNQQFPLTFRAKVVRNNTLERVEKYVLQDKFSFDFYKKIMGKIAQYKSEEPLSILLSEIPLINKLSLNFFLGAEKKYSTKLNKDDLVPCKILYAMEEFLSPASNLSLSVFGNIAAGSEILEEVIEKPSEILELYKQTNPWSEGGLTPYCESVSIIDFIEASRCYGPLEVYNFLAKLSQDPQLSNKMCEEFSKDPRQAKKIEKTLVDCMGGGVSGKELFKAWYHDERYGYRAAYSRYYNQEIWDKAASLDDIVKQSPNIGTWAFVNKAKELGVEPTLGKLPDDFISKEHFKNLMTTIRKVDKMITDDKTVKSYTINVGAQEYEIKFPGKRGYSDKNSVFLTLKGDESKKYMMKYIPQELKGDTWRTHAYKGSRNIRPDMPYLNAMVDFYLKENGCKNVANIRYFDYNENVIIYSLNEGDKPNYKSDNLYLFANSEKVKDIKDLGVILSDFHNGNFLEQEDGTYVLIDSGHVRYSNLFRPTVCGKHISLGNLCGREYVDV